jgi:hypothetical protein
LLKKITVGLFIVSLSVFGACKKESVEGSYDARTLGTSAYDLLSASHYSSLQIEIQYMPGYAPDQAALDGLTAFLQTRVNKPDGISIVQEQLGASSLSVTSLTDIVNIERNNRRLFTHNNVLSVYILITNGHYSTNDVLATSYWNTSCCLFGQAIANSSGQAGQPDRSILLTTLFEHEFGHLMGLVDQGTPMQTNHKDATNGAHCDDPDCLMYFNVEASFSGVLTSVPQLDFNCLADLKANGGK